MPHETKLMIKSLQLLAASLLLTLTTVTAGVPGAGQSYRIPANVTADDYIAKTIVLKVKDQYRASCTNEQINITAVQRILASTNQQSLAKIFPRHLKPARITNDYGMPLIDLSLIYEFQYKSDADLVKTINALLQTGIFEYVEPKFLPKVVAYNPNDPQQASQWFLAKVKLFDAWGVQQGDTNVVIGITDTGTDTDHPDLAANMKHNYNDPINGVDDDNDGYLDNFTGWDVGENDNDAQVGTCGSCDHGSHVAGCADAVTDNGVGVAGPGFKCKFMPVKIADASGSLTKAYEGIAYAADNGCQIINCSWGGAGGGSFGQNIIDYATNNQNCLVVVAAGNNNSSLEFFPAAYPNALCVAATNSNDSKASFSNYGTYIDVCAPGNNIYSTVYDNSYTSMSGTSMASPIAAGCAAIIKSQNPTFTGLQVGEQLRITCDNIYGVAANSGYQGKLGTGRINLFKGLTITGPSVRANNLVTVDNNDNVFIVNDTLRITGDFTNYLSPTTALTVTLSTTSTFVTILDNSTTVGLLGTLATVNNTTDPFTVKINSNAPQNTLITFTLTFVDGTYTSTQTFTKTVNVDYLNITMNDIFTTNSSKGRICYNGTGQTEGLGFDYMNGGTVSYETGFMLGTATGVSDNVRGAAGGATDEDFAATQTIQRNDPSQWSDFDTYGKFNDAVAATPHNLLMNFRTLSWTNAPDSKYHIFEYTIKNNGAALSNLWAGIFSDWDIQTYANNKANEDVSLKMGYAYCTDTSGLYAGIKLLTQNAGFNHYAVDNITGGAGGADLSDGYDETEKFTTLSTPRATAGGTGTGNDVIDVVSTGPFTIATGDSVTVAFALICGSELGDIQASAAAAQIKYDLATAVNENNASIVTINAYPNPATSSTVIPFYLRKMNTVKMEIVDIAGRVIKTENIKNVNLGENQITLDLSGYATGLYHFRLIAGEEVAIGAIQKL